MKIYLVLSVKSLSGGGNSIHQLGEILINRGYDCYLYYYDEFKGITSKFDHYKIPKASKIEDTIDNIVIVPETLVPFLNTISYAKKVIWWLSFDFYYDSFPEKKINDFISNHSLPRCSYSLVKWVSKKTKKIPDFLFSNMELYEVGNDIFHLYNCEYVKGKLLSFGINEENMRYLCGPLEDVFFEDTATKKINNLVLYNPAKGLEFTKKIIAECNAKYPEITFKGLAGMNRAEFQEALKKSKLYIDFGFFPGPERIPREAVMTNCNIITSNVGAANGNIDVPIPECFKFDVTEQAIPQIVEKISYLLTNYEKHISDFDIYRDKG